MKNTKTRQPDPVSGTVAHEGVNKPMNDPMGTASNAAAIPNDGNNSNMDQKDFVVDTLTDSDTIDPDSIIDTADQGDEGDDIHEGLTPMHRQNIDESRIDEVLIEDALDDDHYPTIRDIADNNAVAHSNEDK